MSGHDGDDRDTSMPGGIAIIGMAGRFPGARNVAEFWHNLCGGVESIRHFSDAELEDTFDRATRDAPNFVKARPILENVDQFDAEFFGMYAREAELTDPQQRVFLECSWEALEDAGYDPATYQGAIGVFGGASLNTYFLRNVAAERRTVEQFTDGLQVTGYPYLLGAGMDFLTTRVSHKLDLRGPSMTLATACSTSLLAVAQAAKSLLLYEADMALAGGVSITFPQKRGYQHLEGGMVSADGKCRPFDADASGTVFGSGAGVVLLKRLEDALADGDHVYAVVRGCGVNNDGGAKVGFTAPSPEGQAGAIEMALAQSGVDARTVSYVECHGTATPLGDPIEMAGLTKAFASQTQDTHFCAIGSVKGNVGHLDAAAGVTGLIKTALALEHKMLPASLHYHRPNPNIDFAKTPFFVNASLSAWNPDGPRRAGVSAFGVGGTNVHLIVEEAPARPATVETAVPAPAPAQLFVLSARTPSALRTARANLAAHLRQHNDLPLADIAWSLQAGRRAFDERATLTAADMPELVRKLDSTERADVHTARRLARGADVVFMFPGQGAQHADMGRGLYEHDAEFRSDVDACAAILRPLMAENLLECLYPANRSAEVEQRLMSTHVAQPALFCIEYAMARKLLRYGLRPAAMIGHSVGEFVAAVLAGVMTLEEALHIVAARGRLMQTLPGGAMLAVRLPEADLVPLLDADVSIAAINGPKLCVVAGPFAAIDRMESACKARGVVTRRLHTSHAFHSAMIDPIIAPLKTEVQRAALRAPTIPYVSCVTGDWIRPEEATSADYWSRHAREPVRFADGVNRISDSGRAILIEVGPGNNLTTLALQNTRGRDVPVLGTMQDATRERDDGDTLLEAVGKAWTYGAAPAWQALHGTAVQRVALPTYPFERKRHFIDAPAPSSAASQAPLPQSTAPVLEELAPSVLTPSVLAPAETNFQVLSQESTMHDMRVAIGAILEDLSGEKPASLDAETSFLEMGYDSLFLTQVAQKLQSQMKVKITFRQLLSEYSSIPALAAYLASKVPAPVATPVAAVAAPVAAPVSAKVIPATAGNPVATGGMEGLFRDQLQAMSQLINRQFEILQGAGMAVAATATPTAPVATAPVVAVPAVAVPTTVDSQPSRFAVFDVMAKAGDGGITPEQRAHIDQLVTRYSHRTAGSKNYTQEHRAALADPRVAAGFRAEWKDMVYPIVVTRSKGSKLYDVDGNEYVDLVNGFGQTAFGHAPDFVCEAIKDQLEQGFAIGPQAELAGRVAALFNEMTGNERMTFCNTGSEAVMAAMRIARTVTGREKIVSFNGDYHGQFDEVLVKGVQKPGAAPRSQPVAPGIPGSQVKNMIVLEYGSAESLEYIRAHAEELAAVIVEPVQSRHPNLRPFDFLREVRKITEASGTAFVFDEVVTGFRTHPGGMQAITGIRADLATYGKVVGGGMPIGILAGKTKFMDALDGGQWRFGDDSFPEVGVTFFAGTFVRHPLVLCAAWAVLNHLKQHGQALQDRLNTKTNALTLRLDELFQSHGLTTRVEGYASWFHFNFHNEHPLASLFFFHLRDRGIHIQEGYPCFLTTTHSDADFEKIYDVFKETLEDLQSVGILTGTRGPQTAAAHLPAATDTGSPQAPLTENQLEIWLAAQMSDEASCAFNESVTLRIRGALNEPALQTAVDMVIARHDALRARFSPTGEEMHFAAPQPLHYPKVDFSSRMATEAELAYGEILQIDAQTPFDLVAGPVVRAQLVKLDANTHAFMLTAHHIIADGWSINVIVNELAEIYGALDRGATPQLPAALPFSRYALSKAERDPTDLAKHEQFWLKQFEQRPPTLELPTDRPRPAQKTYSGSSLCRRIDAKLYQTVKKAGARQGSTLFTTLLAAFQALMGRFAGQNEVVVGVPTAGQSLLEDQILVGQCVNFLPLRGSWDAGTKVADFFKATSKRVLDAYEHQDYTFGTLVRTLALAREAGGRLPLAEIQFNLERLADRIETGGVRIDVEPNAKANVNFDIFMNVIESDAGLRIDCDYNTDLFDATTIAHWLDCYEALLESLVADASQAVTQASCLPAADRTLLAAVNDTARAYPRNKTVHALFEAQAKATPQAIAVQFQDEQLSYEMLDRRVNQMANLLRERTGAAPGRLVGVSVERSLDMLVALLAVLKTGSAYVPLDPLHPPARLRQILGEAEVVALISDGSESAALVREGVPVIDVRKEATALATASHDAPDSGASADSLAYTIYTSGSTGQPKGVEISHRAVVNLLLDMARRPGLDARDVFMAVTTISFDIAGLELFMPLIVGARVVIAERDDLMDGFRMLKRLDAVQATAMQATPAGWRMLLEAGFVAKPGFKVLCGGEALPRELANKLAQGAGELWNMYGPTETTIWSSCERVSVGNATVTVGKPIANTQFYVLDVNDQPLPVGVPGQLHIGGDGVAQGYYKRAALTAEKFIANPFAPGRLYRTGDLARWLPDGTLGILGRIDHQIKLRGFRIELDEINAVLTRKAQLANAAVILREDSPGSPRLVAYIVERSKTTRAAETFRELLAEDLPDYMIPSAWVRLDALPLSPNGKLDRAALPAPDAAEIATEVYLAPTTATEATLTKIFAEVLRLDRVGVSADLLQLGADSIQLFQITARANRAGLKITAKQLMQQRTAAATAALADAKGVETVVSDSAPKLPTLGDFKRNRRTG